MDYPIYYDYYGKNVPNHQPEYMFCCDLMCFFDALSYEPPRMMFVFFRITDATTVPQLVVGGLFRALRCLKFPGGTDSWHQAGTADAKDKSSFCSGKLSFGSASQQHFTQQVGNLQIKPLPHMNNSQRFSTSNSQVAIQKACLLARFPLWVAQHLYPNILAHHERQLWNRKKDW